VRQARRDALWAAELDPRPIVLQQVEELAQGGLVEALFDQRAPHVVDDERHRQRVQEAAVGDQVVRSHVQLHVPAQRGDGLGHLEHPGEIGGATQVAHEVEAHAAHAGTVHRFQLRRRSAGRQQGHATSALRIARDGIEHRAVVDAVNGGLHDHDAFDTEQAVQRFQPLHRGIVRRVGPLGRVRESVRGTVDVDVGIARRRRQPERRRRRVVQRRRYGFHAERRGVTS